MKAIITGATGAVGMALIEELLARGAYVTVLCRQGSSRSAQIKESERLKKIDCSLDGMHRLDLGSGYDVFFHLAWDGTTGVQRNDMELQNKNVAYTLDAVRLAHRCGCKVFVGAGSQAECGRHDTPINSKTPAFPENGYGMAKLCAGQMSRGLCAQLGIRHEWARILSVYGKYDGERSLVMSTVAKLLRGERPSLTAGEQTWDFIYSADAARALADIAERGRDGSIYCIGSGDARPLREYVELIRDTVRPDASLGFGEIPYAKEQVMYLCADIDELTADTGFVPRVGFIEGIKETVEWYISKEGKTL